MVADNDQLRHLAQPEAILTAYAVTPRGRATWPPLRAVLDRLRPQPGAELSRPGWPRPEAEA
jgi:hypothetical protein